MSMYAIVNPATGAQLEEYPTISDQDLRGAVQRADAAHVGWSRRTSLGERAQIIGRVGRLHVERRQELAETIVAEMGKPIEQALGEVDFTAGIYEYYAAHAEELMADQPLDVPAGTGGSAIVRRQSLGVLLGIMPWNFPYYQVGRFAAPNLLVGNTILLKHAPQCPESSAAIERMFRDAGVPADAYVNLYATHEQIESVIADPRVRGISLTGSERAGAAVAEIAGRHLKKVVLELGGSNAFVLLSADDLGSVVEAAVAARMFNTGQTCNGAKRFIVLDELYEPFLEAFGAALAALVPADPTEPGGGFLGPLSSAAATDRLSAQLGDAVAQGASVVAGGGTPDGNFFPATLLAGIGPGNDAYSEEFFGPVAQAYRVASEEEAITLANDSPFGLGAYVFSSDREQAVRVAEALDVGMVFINCVSGDGPNMPFGGTKRSGFGRELGQYGLDEFVNHKLVRIGGVDA
ncbi:NAD-dependent succinate-semialdehyde dehydrogenase [Patulibacter sp. NPDC049589]|uniref:NAD-dependent succinate-semialdehyde dehydrogenase n=1 Tax=Patulibacter sp. NPDC049589 TaxID=3154731 RepID=UPI00342D5DD7